jgi:hypothetical protein
MTKAIATKLWYQRGEHQQGSTVTSVEWLPARCSAASLAAAGHSQALKQSAQPCLGCLRDSRCMWPGRRWCLQRAPLGGRWAAPPGAAEGPPGGRGGGTRRQCRPGSGRRRARQRARSAVMHWQHALDAGPLSLTRCVPATPGPGKPCILHIPQGRIPAIPPGSWWWACSTCSTPMSICPCVMWNIQAAAAPHLCEVRHHGAHGHQGLDHLASSCHKASHIREAVLSLCPCPPCCCRGAAAAAAAAAAAVDVTCEPTIEAPLRAALCAQQHA